MLIQTLIKTLANRWQRRQTSSTYRSPRPTSLPTTAMGGGVQLRPWPSFLSLVWEGISTWKLSETKECGAVPQLHTSALCLSHYYVYHPALVCIIPFVPPSSLHSRLWNIAEGPAFPLLLPVHLGGVWVSLGIFFLIKSINLICFSVINKCFIISILLYITYI